MAKRKDDEKGPVTGGAVIIDDGPGKGNENAKDARLLQKPPIRLTSDYKIDEVKKGDKATLDNLNTEAATVTLEVGGDVIKFDWAKVVSYAIGKGAAKVDGLLTTTSLTINVTDKCDKPDPNKKVYHMKDKGPIERTELVLATGSALQWMGIKVKLTLALPNTAPRD